ncbi:hypothetical protein DCC85_04445 [Paenibacillus sp. CAA11]|uniref:DUF2812 domain-containing protein n=1 Tax=Paenibacillus sp. CAA11 TaxID=1532905 RepID=UPI000D3665C8|nr:DUF2812 domain-containing protein [Paenibacillus sp. CAA11]AWB43546.1 hypothetical protein DCC85_04445 [Paenibacillus sp. CAA11]
MKRIPFTKLTGKEYDAWLENYAKQGWHLEKINGLGLLHHFREGEPSKVRYFSDYQGKKPKDYEQIFADSGWELVSSDQEGFYLWRINYDHRERPEVFTDRQSLLGHYRKIITLQLVILLLGTVGAVFFGPENPILFYVYKIAMSAMAVLIGLSCIKDCINYIRIRMEAAS